MKRRHSAAAGSFALLLLSPLLMYAGSPAHAVSNANAAPAQTGDPVLPTNAVAGVGKVNEQMRAEIDRVVSQGQTPTARRALRTGPAAQVATQVRCADFEGQRYCLNTGWTDRSETAVRRQLTSQASAVLARRVQPETTGDLAAVDQIRQRAAMSPTKRAAVERRELVDAARSVAKVWLLRHQIQGEPLPDGFVDRHPEITIGSTPVAARTTSTAVTSTDSDDTGTDPVSTTTTAVKPPSAYPRRSFILNPKRVAAQTRTYWCGPTSMQMIAWGWSGKKRSQQHWANRLGTTTSGTAISEMVRITNADTGYDNKNHAGKYIVLDIGNWSYSDWYLLLMRHIHDYNAPVILHPILLKRFYPYLDDDASGHFQVGRGYDKRGAKANSIKYFEPWNQQRFDPSEPYIARVQSRSAYKSYRANQAHSMHNIGV